MLLTSVIAPPPSPVEETTGPNGLSTNRILCERTIGQTNAPNRFNVDQLLKTPPDNEKWMRCLVPADEIEPDDSNWSQIEHLPGVHVVGKTPDDNLYEVAVCESCVQWLLDNNLPFELTSERGLQYDVAQPREGEIRVHGKWEAVQKAQSRFIRNAVRGILSRHGRGLDQYYRRNTLNQRVLAAIEWAILIRDILASPPEVLRRFVLRCLFLALHLLDDLCSASALALIGREREAWIEYFRYVGRVKTTCPAEDAEAEMHEASLLRGLLESADDKMDAFQHRFDMKRSANDNFAILGRLFDLEFTEPVSFGSFDAPKMRTVLLQCKSFQCDELDAVKLQQQIRSYVPIGFQGEVYETLPADLVNALGYGTVIDVRLLIANTYRQMPSLRKPENDLLVLLCHCTSLRQVDQALRDWVASEEGWCLHRRTMTRMWEPQTPEQAILSLSALLCHELLLKAPDEVSGPNHDSYLHDFGRLLDGHELGNQQAVWERMAFSVRRVVGETCHPAARYFLDIVIGAEPPLHWLDGLSDQYWGHKLGRGLTHGCAWEETRRMLIAKEHCDSGLKPEEEWLVLDVTMGISGMSIDSSEAAL